MLVKYLAMTLTLMMVFKHLQAPTHLVKTHHLQIHKTFTAVQTFTGTNTFGEFTAFPESQDFTTAGTVSSASVSLGDGAINSLSTHECCITFYYCIFWNF